MVQPAKVEQPLNRLKLLGDALEHKIAQEFADHPPVSVREAHRQSILLTAQFFDDNSAALDEIRAAVDDSLSAFRAEIPSKVELQLVSSAGYLSNLLQMLADPLLQHQGQTPPSETAPRRFELENDVMICMRDVPESRAQIVAAAREWLAGAPDPEVRGSAYCLLQRALDEPPDQTAEYLRREPEWVDLFLQGLATEASPSQRVCLSAISGLLPLLVEKRRSAALTAMIDVVDRAALLEPDVWELSMRLLTIVYFNLSRAEQESIEECLRRFLANDSAGKPPCLFEFMRHIQL